MCVWNRCYTFTLYRSDSHIVWGVCMCKRACMCVCCGTADTWSTQAVILNWCHAVCIVSSYIHQLHPKTHNVWTTAGPVSIAALVFSLRQAQRIQIVMYGGGGGGPCKQGEGRGVWLWGFGPKGLKKYFYLNNPRRMVPLGAWYEFLIMLKGFG